MVKELAIKHLNDSIYKVKELEELYKAAEDISAITSEVFGKVPQVFMHLAMVLRLSDEHNFEQVIDQLCEATKHLVAELDLNSQLEVYQEYRQSDAFWFDFTKNQIIDPENVIRATFANP